MCAIAQRYPESVVTLAEAAGVPLPEYDEAVPAPDAHHLRDGRTVYTDGTVRLLRKGRPVFFATVEMQREFRRGKYATLYAYHGSGVSKINAGGHLFVLSDQASETAKFLGGRGTPRGVHVRGIVPLRSGPYRAGGREAAAGRAGDAGRPRRLLGGRAAHAGNAG